MISNYLSLIVFHILFATSIEIASVKILQINEPVLGACDDNKCDMVKKSDVMNMINFVEEKNPDVILWLSKFKTNETLFSKFNKFNQSKVTVLPVFDNDQSQPSCSKFSKVEKNCYYLTFLESNNVPIIVLNTRLWLNSLNDELSTRQINWLDKNLREFQLNRQKVIIVGYDAPGFLEDNPTDSTKYVPEYNKRVVELLQRFSSAISVSIFGSDKIDSFRIVLDNDGKPLVPMFIAPTITRNVLSSISSLRLYEFNAEQSLMDNYIQYHRDTSVNDISVKYNYKTVYNMKNVHVNELYEFADSFVGNVSDNFNKYNQYQLGNVTIPGHCADHCFRCRCRCFIISLTDTSLKSCLGKCSVIDSIGTLITPTGHSQTFNNAYFRLGVIVGFVAILVGIVVAVNKVYCIRLSRHRNVFMVPLPVDLSDDSEIGHMKTENGKLCSSKENIDSGQTRPLNGLKRSNNNHGSEQTYDYIRM